MITEEESIAIMSALQVKVEEERANLTLFLRKCMNTKNLDYIRVNVPPGIGKSYCTAELPRLYPNFNYLYIVPTHKLAGNIKHDMDAFGIRYMHVKGKKHSVIRLNPLGDDTVVPLCERPERDMYYPGCKGCAYKDACEYNQQFKDANRSQVVITTIHNINRFEKSRIVIFDESFDSAMTDKLWIDPEIRNELVFLETNVTKCGANNFQFYDSVILQEDFEVHDKNTYFLNLFFSSNTNIHGILTAEGFTIFGRRKVVMPENFRKIIFNCATTSNELMFNICENPLLYDECEYGWKIYEPLHFKSNELQNPVLKFNTGRNTTWSKNYSKFALKQTFSIFRKWCKPMRLLIITKKSFVDDIKEYFPEADFVWYGNSRGFNDYNKEYDLILVYGNYGMTPVERVKLDKLGFDEETVNLMEKSEILQSIHRGRPILHPMVPIALFTHIKVLPEYETTNFKHFLLFNDKYDVKIDDKPSLRQLMIRLGYSAKSGNVKTAKHYLRIREFVEYMLFGRYRLEHGISI